MGLEGERIMATRTGGRSDDRSNQRSTSGTTGGARGASSGATGSRGASSVSSGGGSTTGRGASSASGSSGVSGAGGAGANRQQNTPDATRQSGATNQSESVGSTGTSSTRTDRERQLRTAREDEGTARAGSSAQRGNVSDQDAWQGIPTLAWVNSPFAVMRRMMDDMDRLFSDFGFMHPGQVASTLFGNEPWTKQSSQRALAGGSPSAGRNLAQRGGRAGSQSLPSLWSPQVEVFERGNNLVVRADLPGLSREDVDVEVDDDALVIRGERRNEFEDQQEGYYRSERSYGTFYRAIPLPDGVDSSDVNATFKDGVLEVTLPKPQPQSSRAKRIEVR
jgi:HSP20 family protein